MKKLFCVLSILLCAVSMVLSQPRSFRLLGMGKALKNSEVFSEYGKYEIEVEWNGNNIIIKAPKIGVLTMSNNLIISKEEEAMEGKIFYYVFDWNSGDEKSRSNGFMYIKDKMSSIDNPKASYFGVIINNDMYIWANPMLYFDSKNQGKNADTNLSYSTLNDDEVVKFIKSLKIETSTLTK